MNLEDTLRLFPSCPSHILYIKVIFRASSMHLDLLPLAIRPHRTATSGTFSRDLCFKSSFKSPM